MRLPLLLSLLPVLLQAELIELVTKTDIMNSCKNENNTACYFTRIQECCGGKDRCVSESHKLLCSQPEAGLHADACKKSPSSSGNTAIRSSCTMESYVVRDWQSVVSGPLPTQPKATDLPFMSRTTTTTNTITTPITSESTSATSDTASMTSTTTAISSTSTATTVARVTSSPVPASTSPVDLDSSTTSSSTTATLSLSTAYYFFIETTTNEENPEINTFENAAVIGGGVILIIIAACVIYVVLKMEKKKRALDKAKKVPEPSKKPSTQMTSAQKTAVVPKAAVISKVPEKKPVNVTSRPPKQEEEEEPEAIQPGNMQAEKFKPMGPLLVRAGQSKPIAHKYEGQKEISLKTVNTNPDNNKAFDIGSEKERYELDTEDCKTYIVSDSQTVVPESQLVSLITGEEKKDEKKPEETQDVPKEGQQKPPEQTSDQQQDKPAANLDRTQ